MLIALEKLGWVKVDGIREQVPQTMAIYSSKILLLRDLISDIIGRLVLQGIWIRSPHSSVKRDVLRI